MNDRRFSAHTRYLILLTALAFAACLGGTRSGMRAFGQEARDTGASPRPAYDEDEGLAGLWNCDEGAGSIVHDGSLNGANGALHGNPRFTNGVSGTGLLFAPEDGIDYVEVDRSPLLDNLQAGDHTVCAWFKPLSVPKEKTARGFPSYGIVMKAGYHIGLSYTQEKRIMFSHYLEGNTWAGAVSDAVIEPGRFYHVAGVVDRARGRITLRIDGWLEFHGEFKKSAPARRFSDESWRIGIGDPNSASHMLPAHGVIDGVRLYPRALTGKEISAIASGADNRPPDVSVSFAPAGKKMSHRACGFLVSFSRDAPAAALIRPLKPRLAASGDLSLYGRVKGFGASFHFLLYAEYMARHMGGLENPDGLWPGDNNDFSVWENYVREIVARVKTGGQTDILWSIWFCPDYPGHWKRSWKQYLETYKRAVRIIRSALPRAVIMGPWLSTFDMAHLTDFIDFASANHVLPNVCTWNEGEFPPTGIPQRAIAVRRLLKEKKTGIERLIVTEIISPHYQFSPGHAVCYMANLHRAGIEATAKSCWPEDYPGNGLNNCFNDSLDGLLDVDKSSPRSLWWAFKLYADMEGRLAEVAPKNTLCAIDGLAAYDAPAAKARILLGRYLRREQGEKDVAVEITAIPDKMLVNGRVKVTLLKIPASGKKPLLSPVSLSKTIVKTEGDTLKVTLPQAGAEDAFLITLTRP
ncbi:MAG: LamG domain-containing protein [Spirochaetales bacterium]|nr:LamG domain-containing protein [Spirochaetales bacterium]